MEYGGTLKVGDMVLYKKRRCKWLKLLVLKWTELHKLK